MARAAICAPRMPPMVPPAAMIGKSRFPSDSVMMSLASDQNCAIDSVLKIPSQTKNANPTDTPAFPSAKNTARQRTNTPKIHFTSRAGSTRFASAL